MSTFLGSTVVCLAFGVATTSKCSETLVGFCYSNTALITGMKHTLTHTHTCSDSAFRVKWSGCKVDFLLNVTWQRTLLPVPCCLSRPETQQKAPVSAPPPPPPPPPPPEPEGPPEPEEEILGSDDEEQEDPADYCKGETMMPQNRSIQGSSQGLLCHTQLQSDPPVSAPVCKFLLCPPPVLIAIKMTCMIVRTPAAQGYLPDNQVLCGRCAVRPIFITQLH